MPDFVRKGDWAYIHKVVWLNRPQNTCDFVLWWDYLGIIDFSLLLPPRHSYYVVHDIIIYCANALWGQSTRHLMLLKMKVLRDQVNDSHRFNILEYNILRFSLKNLPLAGHF